jgi:molybdopterin converting factor small subunit
MKCSNVTPEMRQEAILTEKKRLKLLESEGYDITDAWTTITDIEKAISDKNEARAANISRKHTRKFTTIDADTINTLNANNPTTAKGVKLKVVSGVKDSNGKVSYQVIYPNSVKEYTMSSLVIIADQVDATTMVKGSDPEGINNRPGKDANDVLEHEIELDMSQEGAIDDLFYGLQNFHEESGGAVASDAFQEVQKGWATKYQELANKVDFGTVKVELFKNELLSTSGEVNLDTNVMRLRWNAMSTTAGLGEIFMHEIGHVISADVFAADVKVRRVMEDLRKAVLDSGVTYEVFLENTEKPSNIDIEVAKRKFEYVFDETGNVEEFYAYVTSNESVWNATKDVQIDVQLIKRIEGMTKNKYGKENSWQKLMNGFIDVINKTWLVISGRKGKGSQVVARLVDTIAESAAELDRLKNEKLDADEVSGVYSKAKYHTRKLDEKLVDLIEEKSELVEGLGEKVKKPFSKVTKRLKKIKLVNAAIESGAMSYVWNTVTKDTTRPDVTEMYRVFRQSKGYVEKHTSEIRNAIQEVVGEMYGNDPKDDSTREAIKNLVINADVGKIEGLDSVLLDDKALNELITKEYNAIKAELEGWEKDGKMEDYSRFNQMQGLAEYMVHGTTPVKNQQLNANNIAAAYDVGVKFAKDGITEDWGKTNKERKRRANSDIVEAIDRIVSLMALREIGMADRELVAEFKKNKPEVFEDTVQMYASYIDSMRESAKVGTRDPIQKGYSKAEEGHVKFRLIPKSEVGAQLAVNMRLVGDNEKYSLWKKDKIGVKARLDKVVPYVIVDGVEYYKMVGRVKGTGFSEGAIGLISNTAEGITLSSLLRKNAELSDNSVGMINGAVDKQIRDSISAYSIGNSETVMGLIGGQTAIPVYDHTGSVIDYRIQMTRLEKKMELDEGDTLAEVLSHTFSRSAKTELTREYNEKVVDTILINSREGFAKNPDDYVLVEEYTNEMKDANVPYEKRHDRWKNMPDYTKDYIYKQTNTKGITIHKDFVELMTGEKDVTIGNMKFGNFNMKDHPKAAARIMALESYLQELLGHMKRVMIILDASVVVGNVLSNATVAMVHGIDPITYVSEMSNNWKLLNEYNELSRRKARLEVLGKAGKNVDSRLEAIEKLIEEHEFHSLVKDGQFTPIAEDINVNEKSDGQIHDAINDAIGTSRFSDAIRGVKNVLYIDKGSKVGKVALKNTQFQDAMTRRIIQNKMEQRAETKFKKELLQEQMDLRKEKLSDAQYEQRMYKLSLKYEAKMEKEVQKILDYLDQLLVNYGYTMNRYWNYSEKVMGLLFLRYYFGQAKAIASMTVKNPVGMFLMGGSQLGTGVDFVYDPLETYASSPLEAMANRYMMDDLVGKLIDPNVFDMFKVFG